MDVRWWSLLLTFSVVSTTSIMFALNYVMPRTDILAEFVLVREEINAEQIRAMESQILDLETARCLLYDLSVEEDVCLVGVQIDAEKRRYAREWER